jgi:hypothetical protein
MSWFEVDGKRVWAGCHRILGAVVFDPGDQRGVPVNRARLFVMHDQSITQFDKQTALRCIIAPSDKAALSRAVEAYRLQQLHSRAGQWSGESRTRASLTRSGTPNLRVFRAETVRETAIDRTQ